MAHATHLTIATGDRVRLSFPPGDTPCCGACDPVHDGNDAGNEIHQEVQVSVTYALDGDDTDLAALATEKAGEVKLAHTAAWHGIGAFPVSRTCQGSAQGAGCSSPCPNHGSGNHGDQIRDDPSGREAARQGNGRQVGTTLHPGAPPSSQSQSPSPLGSPSPVVSAGHPAAGPTVQNGVTQDARFQRERVESGRTERERYEASLAQTPVPEFASKPQKILIRSLSQKAGLSAAGLDEVVWKQYQRRSVELLTKPEAKAVIAALERSGQTGRIEMGEPVMNEPMMGEAVPSEPAKPASEITGPKVGGYPPGYPPGYQPGMQGNVMGNVMADGLEVAMTDDEMIAEYMTEEDDWEPQDEDAPHYV